MHRELPEDREALEKIVFEDNSFTRVIRERLQEARDVVERAAGWVALDYELSDGILDNLAELEDSNDLLRQEINQLQQLHDEIEDRAARALRQVKELREMNSQMAAQLHSAEERAKVLEANAKAQQSRSGSTGLQPMGSQASNPVQEELVQARDQALNAENESQRLRAEVTRLQEQVRTLRKEFEKRPQVVVPSVAVGTSKEPLRSYTLIADYQWQITRKKEPSRCTTMRKRCMS